MIEKLNKLLADLTVLQNKVHTFHYNVVGIDFHPTHLFLDEQYNQIFGYCDGVAEQIKINDGYPIGTLKEAIDLSTIEEAEARDYNSKEIYTTLIKDYETVISECIEISRDYEPSSEQIFVDNIIEELSVKLWFMKASNK